MERALASSIIGSAIFLAAFQSRLTKLVNAAHSELYEMVLAFCRSAASAEAIAPASADAFGYPRKIRAIAKCQ